MHRVSKRRLVIVIALILASGVAFAQDRPVQVVAIRARDATLQAHLWRPAGKGPFPAILINHGSGRTRDQLRQLGPYEQQSETLGPVFARHGYLCLFLFRRGVGPSTDQGENAIDAMNREQAEHGQAAGDSIQLHLLEHRELDDAAAALAFLRTLPDVDAHRIALVGHSFGGSLTLLLAERDTAIRAIVLFSAAGYSWDRSSKLRTRLLASLSRIQAPVFFIHAANDYSVTPGRVMDERLAQLKKPHRLEIYPPIGRTPDDGHAFPFTGVRIWEPDVFAFLNEYMQQ
ncbi:MAG TPA: alpha/beta fold hydrolase [Gemmatimonadaceae bacterium]